MNDQNELSIFISYSREDLQFVEQLVASLQAFGFSATTDHLGIHGAERWRDRLRQLILEGDAFIFVLSPASVISEVCLWELEQAQGLSKRIIPILCRPLADTSVPDSVGALNYIYFYAEPSVPRSGFGNGLAGLVDTLLTDIEWLREHTRLGELAERWNKASRTEDLLLHGSEIEAAIHWRESRPVKAPEVTALQGAFISESEQAENARVDKERQRLKEMAAAQADRQKALERAEQSQIEREAATKQLLVRTKLGIVVAVVLSLSSLTAAGFAVHFGNQATIEAERANKAWFVAEEEKRLQARLLLIAQNRSVPEQPFNIDVLSRRYEGQNPDYIFKDAQGRFYYGIFRIKAGRYEAGKIIQGENMQEFFAFLRRAHQLRSFYQKLEAAGGRVAAAKHTQGFIDSWRGLALDPNSKNLFAEAQQAFILNTDYARVSSRLAKPPRDQNMPGKLGGFGLDLTTRSRALQAVIFSVAVQYGPNSSILDDTLGGIDDVSELDDRQIIERIYAGRDQVDKYFPELVSDSYAELIKQRNKWEKQDAIFIFESESKK